MSFNPDQERDEHGRWTSGGGSDARDRNEAAMDKMFANQERLDGMLDGARAIMEGNGVSERAMTQAEARVSNTVARADEPRAMTFAEDNGREVGRILGQDGLDHRGFTATVRAYSRWVEGRAIESGHTKGDANRLRERFIKGAEAGWRLHASD